MTKSVLILSVVAAVSLPIAARANLITGVLNIGGTAELTSDGISFLDSEFLINSPASAQQGGFMVLAGTTGTIDNITNPPDATGALNVPDFMTFSVAPNITITLTFLDPGFDGAAGCTSSPAAPGQVCTPSGSPLNMQNTSATSSALSFGVNGVEVDSLTGDTTPITGLFTLPLTSQNFQHLLATVNGGGTVTTSFAGQFATSAPVTNPSPEPRALILMLTGIGLMGLARFRSRWFSFGK